MTRASRPRRSRLAAVGAALSLVASLASVGLAAERGVAPGAPARQAGEPAAGAAPPTTRPAVDDDLLEFLGSIGDATEEGDWLDFLWNTDIDKVAKRGSKTPPRDR